jgi:hypothetical protein
VAHKIFQTRAQFLGERPKYSRQGHNFFGSLQKILGGAKNLLDTRKNLGGAPKFWGEEKMFLEIPTNLGGVHKFLDINTIFSDARTIFREAQKFCRSRSNFLGSGHKFWGRKFSGPRTIFWTGAQFFCSRTKLFQAHTIFLTRAQFFGTAQYFGTFIKYSGYAHNLLARQQIFLGGAQIFLYISAIFVMHIKFSEYQHICCVRRKKCWTSEYYFWSGALLLGGT